MRISSLSVKARLFITISICSIVCLVSTAQNYIGLRIGVNAHKLENISTDFDRGWFYLGSKFETEQNFSITSGLSYKRSLNKYINFTTGIGHYRYRQNISLKHNHPFFGNLSDTLSIAVDYLEVPIGVQFYGNLTKTKSIGLGLEILTNFQLYQKDNFTKIIYEEVNFLKRNWYSKWLFNPKLSLRMKHKFNDSRLIEYSIYTSRTINPLVTKASYGFFEQMKKSHLMLYGFEINYFFTI
jgi:hypothetical protein